jgi:spoIIIJ-associated protein
MSESAQRHDDEGAARPGDEADPAAAVQDLNDAHDVHDAQDEQSVQDEKFVQDEQSAQAAGSLEVVTEQETPVQAPAGDGPAPRRSADRVAQLEREGEVAADFLETLLDIADLDGDLDVDVEGDRAIVAIVDSDEGRVPRRLVGPDGKVLEALQELTRLAVQAETGERSRLMLDIAGHRAQRRSALEELARRAVADVKESGTKQELEPMTAFERKVVHDEVAAAGLVSESEGVEPNRYVVILPD